MDKNKKNFYRNDFKGNVRKALSMWESSDELIATDITGAYTGTANPFNSGSGAYNNGMASNFVLPIPPAVLFDDLEDDIEPEQDADDL